MTPAQQVAAAIVVKQCADVLDSSPDGADEMMAAKAKAWLVRSGHAQLSPTLSVEEARELVASL